MTGIRLDERMEVYPGAATRYFDSIVWQDLNLFVYGNAEQVFITQNGEQLLQSFCLAEVADAGLCRESGFLCISSSSKISIYRPVLLYKQPLRWELYCEHEVANIQNIAWISSKYLSMIDTENNISFIDPSRGTIELVEKTVGGGRNLIPGTGKLFQYGSGIPKLWHLEINNTLSMKCFDYVPQVSLIIWANCLDSWLVTFSEDKIVRIWLTEPVASIAYSYQCDEEMYPIVSIDREALLLVASNAVETKYIRISPHSGLSMSKGGPLNFRSFQASSRVVSLPGYLYVCDFDNRVVDTYQNGNWEPVYTSSYTGTKARYIRASDIGFTTYGDSSAIDWTYSGTVSQHRLTLPEDVAADHLLTKSSRVWAMVSSDAKKLYLGSKEYPADGLLNIYDIGDGNIMAVFATKIQFLPSLKSVDVNSELASYSRGQFCSYSNNEIRVWEVAGFELRKIASLDAGDVDALAISDYFVLYGNTEVTVWDTLTNQTSILLEQAPDLIEFSNDGRFLAVAVQSTVHVFCKRQIIHRDWIPVQTTTLEHEPVSMTWLKNNYLALLDVKGSIVIISDRLDRDSIRTLCSSQGIVASCQTLEEAYTNINEELPVYHPLVLVHLWIAQQTEYVQTVLAVLQQKIRYADTTDLGIVSIERSLGIQSSSHTENTVDTEELKDQLVACRLPGLSPDDHRSLISLVDRVAKSADNHSLDVPGKIFEVIKSLYPGNDARSFIWATLSQSKRSLMSSLPTVSWEEFYREGFAYWLEIDSLAGLVETLARSEFAKNRDPTEVSLIFIALDKLTILQGLWKVCAGNPEREKTMKLLSNDFNDPRWRTAAQKNAYALLSRHRDNYAAGLFLLGGSINDCTQTLINKCQNQSLAVSIARIRDGTNGDALQYIADRFFDPADLWLSAWLSIFKNRREDTVKILTTIKDPVVVWILDQFFGGVTKTMLDTTKQTYKDMGMSIMAEVLSEKIVPTEKVAISDEKLDKPAAGTDGSALEPVPEPSEGIQKSDEYEEWKAPAHLNLKPAPTDIQLEPDMSAFGF